MGVIDYGAGNVFSLETMLLRIGVPYFLSHDIKSLSSASHIILPGVGHFQRAIHCLQRHDLVDFIREVVKQDQQYLMGICLGMLVLATKGYEGGETTGIGVIAGEVTKLPTTPKARVPQVGWNELHFSTNSPDAFKQVTLGETVYFNHGYHFELRERLPVAWTYHDDKKVLAAFQKRKVLGVQFHPEKSQSVGQRIFQQFFSSNNC